MPLTGPSQVAPHRAHERVSMCEVLGWVSLRNGLIDNTLPWRSGYLLLVAYLQAEDWGIRVFGVGGRIGTPGTSQVPIGARCILDGPDAEAGVERLLTEAIRVKGAIKDSGVARGKEQLPAVILGIQELVPGLSPPPPGQ